MNLNTYKPIKKVFITGVTGQDGSYLSELLLNKGYKVFGMVRRTSTMNRERIEHLRNNPNFKLFYGDLSDSSSINTLLHEIMPDEVYNLAAQSHVRISFDIPESTGDIDGLGVIRILEVLRRIKNETRKQIKFYQASTSELYGKVIETPQNETTPFNPRSPYAIAKMYAFWITKNYRESYNMFACNGILFNHESPRRGENFVTKKIVREVARIKEGMNKCIYLGNINSKRDWGHAKDYVEAMWLMLQQKEPKDYVIATGETHSILEFLNEAFRYVGIKIKSNGKTGIKEEFVREDTGETVVKISEKYFRPTEVDILIGDPSKANKELGWKPKILFKDLVKNMMEEEIINLKKELHGSKI